ncbi:MAG TPA: c-type cytochrome [Burkholderiaceae bacterium]|nr:c-type cytochrome [Burkholderiaceae bacterium]
MKRSLIALALGLGLPALVVHAQTAAPNNLGARIATQGVEGAAACVGCHGANGEGNAAGGFPKLAAQSADYLARQLVAYANGVRQNPVMMPIAKGLNDEQRVAVSRYYADLKPVVAASPVNATAADAASLARGRTLARIGDSQLRVQACANCHGPGGIGAPPVYPYLAGQHREYLVAALNEWKNTARNTDPSGQMPSIARALSDADIAAVALYFARQPGPPPLASRVLVPPRATRIDRVPSGPTAPPQPSRDVGVEQGTPTSGNQGQAPAQPNTSQPTK